MNLVDYLLEKCQHDLSLCKNEMANIHQIAKINTAMNIIQEIKCERTGK